MKKSFIVEDSSFVISVIDRNDTFHKDALFIYQELKKYHDDILILIPSIVFFESVITLVKKGVDRGKVENSLWKFLHIKNVRNIGLVETTAFRFCRNMQNKRGFTKLRTNDFLIASVAMDYSAQIITFDVKMRNRLKKSYDPIYCCATIGSQQDETNDFLDELRLDISGEKQGSNSNTVVTEDDIPF